MSRTSSSNPIVEPLEGRTLFAGTPLAVAEAAYLGGTQLRVTGTTAADAITVEQTADGLVVRNTGGWSQTFTGSYKSLRIDAGAGNDSVALAASLAIDAVLYGGAGNDILTGGAGDDRLYGGLGTNTLNAGAGDDVLVTVGGGVNDRATGGAGRDSFWVDLGSKETVTDPSAQEAATGSLHRVNSFTAASNKTATTPAKRVQSPTGKVGRPKKTVKAPKPAPANPKDLLGQDLVDPVLSSGSMEYAEFAGRPLFADGGPSPDDVSQGGVGDCYFLAVLSSVARVNPTEIRESVVDLGDGTYGVQFTKGGNHVFVRVDNQLARWAGMDDLAYAGFGAQGSMWVAVMEKAYAFFRTGAGTYRSLDSGWMSEGYAALGAASASTYSASGASALLNLIKNDLAAGKSVTYAVATPAAGSNLCRFHAYMVDGVVQDASGRPTHLRLRNPWGTDGDAVTDGSNDGYVTVTAQQAYASLLGFTSAAV